MNIGKEQQGEGHGTSQVACHLPSESYISLFRCGWRLEGTGRFYISLLRLPEDLPSTYQVIQQENKNSSGFSFVSVLLWVQAPELAAASLSNDTREKGTFMLSSLLAYPVSVSSHLVTSLSQSVLCLSRKRKTSELWHQTPLETGQCLGRNQALQLGFHLQQDFPGENAQRSNSKEFSQDLQCHRPGFCSSKTHRHATNPTPKPFTDPHDLCWEHSSVISLPPSKAGGSLRSSWMPVASLPMWQQAAQRTEGAQGPGPSTQWCQREIPCPKEGLQGHYPREKIWDQTRHRDPASLHGFARLHTVP